MMRRLSVALGLAACAAPCGAADFAPPVRLKGADAAVRVEAPGYACPAWVDVDGDGDLDILYPNGDSLDPPPVLKPYHGVQWLENVGGERPFVPHRIGYLPGVMAATAADFDGDGDIDFAAVAYLPASAFPDREARRLPAVVLYEQTAPGTFAPHVLERGACDHLACAAAVLPGDRLPSLVVSGGCFMNKTRPLPGLTVWRNRGKP